MKVWSLYVACDMIIDHFLIKKKMLNVNEYQWQVALDLKNSKNHANSVVVSDMASLHKGFQFTGPRGARLDFTSPFNYWKSTNNIN